MIGRSVLGKFGCRLLFGCLEAFGCLVNFLGELLLAVKCLWGSGEGRGCSDPPGAVKKLQEWKEGRSYRELL